MSTEQWEESLGARLRDLRIRGRLTQVELADQANVSVGALQHLERGAGATVSTLVKVLRALGQEGWIEQLGPDPAPFNPMDLVQARERGRRRAGPPSRVRHRRAPGP